MNLPNLNLKHGHTTRNGRLEKDTTKGYMYREKKKRNENGRREEMVTLNGTFFIHECTRQSQNESCV